ncbi:hypothetical protein [Shimia sp.]|uniref:hypothetical protein n=1 Tax=Shimia sp. TaxID=1954381 RepID=UPI003BAD8E3E
MTNVPAHVTKLPTPTPRLTQSLSPHEVEDHRARIAFEVEIVLQGYWQAPLSPEMKGAVLADWCDDLEDWPQDQVRAALREWRSRNPSKRPNPGHISEILKLWRGREYASSLPPKAEGARDAPCTKERAKEIMEEVGFRPRKFGGSK